MGQIAGVCCKKTQAVIALWAILVLTQQVTYAQDDYDFIIVGGGTAGCLLAARLSEVSNWKVLLLEAGFSEHFFNDIPLIGPMFILSPYNWGFRAEKSDKFGLGLKDGRLIYPKGKGLGGSSLINAQIYTKGNRKDYDKWAEMGNEGWNYANVTKYFLKHEKMNIPQLQKETKYHSTTGELDISYPPYHTELATAFIDSGIEKGYKYVDYNGVNQTGFSYVQTTMKNGERVSSYGAFLRGVKRDNLVIKTKSTVTKIIIDPKTGKAKGVEYKMFNLIPRKAFAKKEVILSAGAINSPQLLMLSGIGPKKHLEKHNIIVIKDLAVGHNLQDHVGLLSFFFTINKTEDIRLDHMMNVFKNAIRYVKDDSGEFTVPSGFEAINFVDIGDKDDRPEMELFFAGQLLPTIPFYLSPLGVLNESYNEFYSDLKEKNGFTILPILLHPYSSGKIELKDTNPHSDPLIYPGYFSDHRDLEVIIKGLNHALNIIDAEALKKFGAEVYRKPLPPCRGYTFGSDDYWECSIRQLTLCIQHAAGTAKMGPASDPDAVVDPRLRVKGFDNLRVVDASVMPTVPSGHTMAPVYMIAEKAADMIKEDWKQ
ncbi:glucose dehydrogenase [FAD, quinone]-like [Periplaneta americana]|uniref:glucose dehydrogenase [FAD, quinone]-like n=1 Tax=Periplaneta americana TaxID=6978 RepID=UPI0037E81C35